MSDAPPDAQHTEPSTAGDRLADPGFLVTTPPEQVAGLLDHASSPSASPAAAVYRTSAHLHRDTGTGVRRQLLALDAARFGERELSSRITAVPVTGEPAARWSVDWATGSGADHRFRHALTGHDGRVTAVGTVAMDGRAMAITGGADGTARVWDLTTRQQVGAPLTGHTGRVCAVATVVGDGRTSWSVAARTRRCGRGTWPPGGRSGRLWCSRCR